MPEITTFDTQTGELGAVRTGSSMAVLTRHLKPGQGHVKGGHCRHEKCVNLKTGRVNKKRGADDASR
ncbi:MAG: hypothetical protein AB7G24_00750 [Novosphingobium sp.]